MPGGSARRNPWRELDSARRNRFSVLTWMVRPKHTWSLAPYSGFLSSCAARRPSAVHDAWQVTRLNRVTKLQGVILARTPLTHIEALRWEKVRTDLHAVR